MNKMVKIEPRIFDELKKALSYFNGKYLIGEELNRSKFADDLRNYDEALLNKLFELDFINHHFIKEISGQKIFQIEQLEEAVLYNDYWDTSYTKYENRIGLASKGKYLQDSQDIVLDFPFKDGVLTASMTKEDNENGYDDAFLNEIIEKDEIDRLFDNKILTNVKKISEAQYSLDKNNEFLSFDKEKDNLIIKGNNLLALHTIHRQFAGKIQAIYIDPPYNTANDSFRYNDKFNESSWLTFMKNRLEVAWELLRDDGLIFIHLDYNEVHYAKVLMDTLFGKDKFVNEIIWRRKQATSFGKAKFGITNDTILMYSKSENYKFNTVYSLDDQHTQNYIEERFTNIEEGTGRRYMKSPLVNSLYRPNLKYVFQGINPPEKGWLYSKVKMQQFYENNELIIPSDPNARIYRKIYLDSYKGQIVQNIWLDIPIVNPMAKEQEDFQTQKPEKLLKRIIEASTDEGDIILDFFMGSGTTQGTALKMNRRFIGIEQMDYLNEITIPRLEKIINGDQSGISKQVKWTGGGSFIYAELLPKNMGYLQDIIHSKSVEELKSVYDRMLEGNDTDEPADIAFCADLSKIDWTQGFNENKRLLVKLLDKNGLYYNYSEIDDVNVRGLITDEDYFFNKGFYEGGK